MIALIPARGGSKGLPGKNIIDFDGKPLIAHTIDAALKAQSITEVHVSTDCPDIKALAIEAGAVVLSLRPPELAGDNAKAIDVYMHFIDEWQRDSGKDIAELVVLLPTCPLRKEEHIDEAVAMYTNKQADSVISYTQEHHPVQWHKYLRKDGSFENIFPETLENRQKERVSYFPNGAIYVLSTNLLSAGTYYSEKSYAYIMDRCFSVDIDTKEDLDFALYLKRYVHD